MPQINAPELARGIRAHYGVRGAQGFDTVNPELVAVSIVDDIRRESGRLCMGAVELGAVAAERSFSVLQAVGTAVQVRPLGVWATINTTEEFVVMATTATSITIVAGEKAYMDRRLRGDPSAIVGGGDEAALPAGDVIWRGRIIADTPYYVPLDGMVLNNGTVAIPGATRIVAGFNVVNVGGRVSWRWVEDPAVPGDVVS